MAVALKGILDTHGVEMLMHQVDLEIQEATAHALKALPPPAGEALRFLYSERVDPTSSEFEAEPHFDGDPRTMVDEINLTLNEEMRRNPKIVVFGEDVADCSREANLTRGQGQGRRVQSHAGTADRYGSQRVFQHSHRRGMHRRPGDGHGHARAQAGGGDSVFRLHLAGDDADPR